ncbi:MAG: DUF3078 domain-containing protein [Bacteroidales bacterium]|nr:DUF3078 domain-containing protein [Bacteroidales bacterium]
MAQDTIAQTPAYSIKIDTITRIDTTYIIDTIIKKVTFVKIDTIYPEQPEVINKNDAKQKIWQKFEGSVSLTVNQLAITHWAAGGESNTSGKATANLKYTYNRSLFNYVLNGLFAYGAQSFSKDSRMEKTEDRLEVSMTMTHNNNKDLTFTSIVMLKTQFTNGYSYPNDSVPISKFFAPAYLTISIGYTYNINKNISIFASPAAGKLTFVNDQTLADKGSYGVEAGYWNIIDSDSTWVPGRKFLGELGLNLLIKYKQDFKSNISIFSNLNLYNNYMDVNRANRWNIDVDWETGVKFTVNKNISAVVNVHMIYDDNVKFTIDDEQKPILQFKESLGISFLYKFATDNRKN